jgi:RimJ/RimL family protein N-acetyltransferase
MQVITSRLLLREFVLKDWRSVLAYQREPEYLRFYPWYNRSAVDVRDFVQQFIAWQDEAPRTRFQLAIMLGDQQEQLIGNCGLRKEYDAATEAELGYELAPWHWKQGYATEATRALLAVGFNELHLHRIFACCIADNSASVRVLEKLGMRCEGCLREQFWMKGRWWDTLVYSILDQEWQAHTI